MCKREGVVEAELAFVYQQMAELRQKDEPQWSEDDKRLLLILKKCAGELETEKKTIAIHKKQLERCRSFIKQLTAKLKPGEIVIWRDFVNQYTLGCDKDVQGNQLKNLVLVMVWMENGRLYSRTFHHFCTDSSSYSTDSAYVADVFDYYLRPKSEEYPGTLERFQTLYLCGDHGSHFSGVTTLYYESTWFEQFQKKVVDFFLPSYHAFSVCDGAGVPPARIAMSLNKQGYTLFNAGDYARACNDSNSTFEAIAFDRIRRNQGFFPSDLKVRGDTYDKEFDVKVPLKRYCEVAMPTTNLLGFLLTGQIMFAAFCSIFSVKQRGAPCKLSCFALFAKRGTSGFPPTQEVEDTAC